MFLPLQLTTKVEIHSRRKWAEKNALVSYSDGALGRLTDDGGGDEEAELNLPSLCCLPEGWDMICRRTWTAIRPAALTPTHSAKNTSLISQITETRR